MPMSGVRSQELPLHGELSTRSLAPAASTAGWLASMASAGSLTPLGRYGVGGLPTETLLSADTALASVGTVRAAVRDNSATRMPTRRAIVGFLPRWDLGEHTVRNRQGPEFLLSPVAIGISIADRRRPRDGPLWLDQADARGPVGERGAGVAAGSDRGRQPLGEGAGLRDVLGGDPDVVAVDRGRAVGAPACPRRVADERLVAGEPVRRPEALAGDLDRAGAVVGVQARERGGRVVVRADKGEGDHSPPARGHPDVRVGQVVACHAELALLDDAAVQAGRGDLRGHHVERDAGLGRAADADGRAERAPDLAVGEDHLLHAGVAGVEA